MFLWWGGVFSGGGVVMFLWCCDGVFMEVFLWWCFGGVFAMVFCRDVWVVFLWWWVVFWWWCFCGLFGVIKLVSFFS